MKQFIYIIYLLLVFIQISTSFMRINKFIHNFKLKLFQYDDDNISSIYKEMELINWNENIAEDKFYYIVGHKNLKFMLLINEMKQLNICCIFIPITTYKITDIDYIFSNIMRNQYNIDFIKPNITDINKFDDFLIFDQNKYIGGLYEIYSILYKDI